MRLVAHFPALQAEEDEPLCMWFEGGTGDLAGRLNGMVSGSSAGQL